MKDLIVIIIGAMGVGFIIGIVFITGGIVRQFSAGYIPKLFEKYVQIKPELQKELQRKALTGK